MSLISTIDVIGSRVDEFPLDGEGVVVKDFVPYKFYEEWIVMDVPDVFLFLCVNDWKAYLVNSSTREAIEYRDVRVLLDCVNGVYYRLDGETWSVMARFEPGLSPDEDRS